VGRAATREIAMAAFKAAWATCRTARARGIGLNPSTDHPRRGPPHANPHRLPHPVATAFGGTLLPAGVIGSSSGLFPGCERGSV
jgi:hypothetical protein